MILRILSVLILSLVSINISIAANKYKYLTKKDIEFAYKYFNTEYHYNSTFFESFPNRYKYYNYDEKLFKFDISYIVTYNKNFFLKQENQQKLKKLLNQYYIKDLDKSLQFIFSKINMNYDFSLFLLSTLDDFDRLLIAESPYLYYVKLHEDLYEDEKLKLKNFLKKYCKEVNNLTFNIPKSTNEKEKAFYNYITNKKENPCYQPLD